MRPPSHRARRAARRRSSLLVSGLLVTGLVGSVGVATALVPRLADSGEVTRTVASAHPDRLDEETASRAPLPITRSADRVARARVAAALARQEAREAMRKEREARRKEREAAARRAAARRERQERRERRRAANAPFTVRVGSFNVLGSQHTDADGPRHQFPPASVRTERAASLVARHGVDILATQELQADQLRGLQARTGLAAWPGFGWGEAETDNSILYDSGRFGFVSGSQFTLTFMDRPRPQPILRLRHLATGREFYVVNTHPSAGGGRYVTQRRNGQAALVSVVRELQATGLPILVTGDMNDRAEFYCRVVAPAGLSASNGGSHDAGCRPPPEPMPVDWVVGDEVTWSGYWRDTSPVTQRTSDHFFISATAGFD